MIHRKNEKTPHGQNPRGEILLFAQACRFVAALSIAIRHLNVYEVTLAVVIFGTGFDCRVIERIIGGHAAAQIADWLIIGF